MTTPKHRASILFWTSRSFTLRIEARNHSAGSSRRAVHLRGATGIVPIHGASPEPNWRFMA